MSILRNRLLLLIVSLLLFGGYSHQVLATCDDGAAQKMEQSGGKKEEQPSKDGCQCLCLCHQTISNSPLIPAGLPHPVLVAQPAFLAAGDAPPERLPQGIDHPPQLS